MINIVTAVSKYVFILLGAVFCLHGFLGHVFYKKRREQGKQRKGIIQIIIVICMTVLGNVILFMNRQDFLFIVFLFMELFYFFFLLNIFPMIYKRCNRILLNDMAFLMCTGMLMLARLDTDKLIRQYLLIWAGTFVLMLVPVIVEKLHFLIKLDVLYCVAGIVLLGVVFVLGNTVYGANLSINIGGFSLQPSEFVKLTYVMFIACMLRGEKSFGRIVITSLCAAAHVLILVASNDLGAALIFYVTYIVMLYDATHKHRYLVMGGLCAVLAGVGAYFVISHVRVRVDVWLAPFKYIDGKGYQLVQSIFAIGNGGWFGTGLTKGLPGSIPVVTKDFIFPAISEELGGLFGIIVIMVCLNVFLEIITVLSENKDSFNRQLLGGFGIMYIFQCFLNIGGTINCIPSTGVTLPFVSYGGSSVISSMIMIAIIQGIAARNDRDNPQAAEDGEERADIPGADKYGTDSGDTGEKSEKNGGTRSMRSPRMVVGSLLLVLIISGFYIYELASFDESILDSTYNRRLSKMKEQTLRGSIYAATGEELASSVEGVNGEAERVYTYGRLFSHIIGYTYGEGAGLEGVLNYQLLRSSEPFDDKLHAELTNHKYRGNSVVTTLDYDMQSAAYEALGVNKGAVVVMDRNGAVLAMVSKPDFNPNTLMTEGTDANADAPLLNRAVAGLYPPGSTFKTVTLLSYYRECNAGERFKNFVYECSGVFTRGTLSVACVGHTAHGSVDTYGAFAHSCNGAFITMGLDTAVETSINTAQQLLFNTDIHYHDNLGPVTSRSQYVLGGESPEWEIIQTSFGQGATLITPLHNALIMQAVANGGTLYEPYIVKTIFASVGQSDQTPVSRKIVYSYDGSDGDEYYGSIMTEDEADMLSGHLKQVIEVSFQHVFSEAPYEAAGKSGTAQYGTSGYEHSLFAGYMPYDDPEIIVSVVLESFNEGGTPDRYAVNVAKEIFDAWYNKNH